MRAARSLDFAPVGRACYHDSQWWFGLPAVAIVGPRFWSVAMGQSDRVRSRSRRTGVDAGGCEGFRTMTSRRQAVRAGVFGALGLSLGDLLRLEARGEAGTSAF
jgi:hypothetical protein